MPPTVTPSSVIISEDSLTDTELDDFHLEEAVGSILREVEVCDRHKMLYTAMHSRSKIVGATATDNSLIHA